MASRKPVIHGRDHLPGGADPVRFVIPTSRYSNEVINTLSGGLVLYWKLDELGNTTVEAVDSSGLGHSGAYGVSPAHPTLGVAALADGTSATFDGADDIVAIGGGTTAVNSLCGFGQMSVEFWTKTSASGSGAKTFVGSDTSNANGRYFKVLLDTGGGIKYVIFGTDATGHSATGSVVVNDGARHYVICTFDGTDMKIYVDGVLDVTVTPAMGGYPLANTSHGMSVGRGMPQGGGFFIDDPIAATMDEVALYTVALTLGEIQTHYLVGGTAANPPSGTAGGDLTGNYPDPQIATGAVDASEIADGAVTNVKLADTGPGATGPIGDGTHVPVITINNKGLVTALTSAVITGGGGGATKQVPVALRAYDSTGNAYAAAVFTSNIREVVWAFTKDVVGDWWGIVRVPKDYSSGGEIILATAANATSGVTTIGLATKPVSDAVVYDAALTAETDQDITVPATAYKRKDVTFTLTPTLAAGDDLIVRIRHNGTAANDTLAVDTLLFNAVLEYTA